MLPLMKTGEDGVKIAQPILTFLFKLYILLTNNLLLYMLHYIFLRNVGTSINHLLGAKSALLFFLHFE